MKSRIATGIAVALACSMTLAGVVMEMEVTKPGAAGETTTDMVYAQGEALRIDEDATEGVAKSLIFSDDTLWMVDRTKNVCQKIDEEEMQQLGDQLGGAMKQIDEQLAQLPPDKRAMVEKMMKGKMPGMPETAENVPARRVERGAVDEVGDYHCTVHTVYSGERKIREVCAADENALSEAAEAMPAFRAMNRFSEQLRTSLSQAPFAKMFDKALENMDAVDGIPVRTRRFSGDLVVSESTLRSVSRRALGEDLFEIPDDCEVRGMASEMKKTRRH